mgnify:CR=1 FL=1
MTGCKFGKGVLINSNACIGHDTIVHDFCNINPGVSLAGNILIEECVTIGIGAVVKEGLKKKGKKIYAPMPNKTIEVEICNPVFIDPSNERLSA